LFRSPWCVLPGLRHLVRGLTPRGPTPGRSWPCVWFQRVPPVQNSAITRRRPVHLFWSTVGTCSGLVVPGGGGTHRLLDGAWVLAHRLAKERPYRPPDPGDHPAGHTG